MDAFLSNFVYFILSVVNVSEDRYKITGEKKKCPSINLVKLVKENNVSRKQWGFFGNISNPKKFYSSFSIGCYKYFGQPNIHLHICVCVCVCVYKNVCFTQNNFLSFFIFFFQFSCLTIFTIYIWLFPCDIIEHAFLIF